jgi:hypothetical protein
VTDDPTTPLLIGDFYQGFDGPTILLVLPSREGVDWLRAVFDNLSHARPAVAIRLDAERRVSLNPSIPRLTLQVVERQVRPALSRDSAGNVTWSRTATEWSDASLLMEPLQRQAGHQYLTSADSDDALVEISFGERHEGTFGVRDG